MIRLFVGLELPEDLRDALERLGGGIPGARWIPGENYHVTLRFIGEVDEDEGNDLHEALADVRAPAFDMEVCGFGAFQNGHRAHSLWAGVEKTPPLQHLHDKIDRALVRTGREPERRKFAPHITVAKLKGAPTHKIQDFIAHHNLFRYGPFPVEHFTLFSSILGRGGATYTAEAEYPLVLGG